MGGGGGKVKFYAVYDPFGMEVSFIRRNEKERSALTCREGRVGNADDGGGSGGEAQGSIILRYVSVAQVWSEATPLRYATTYNAYYV